VPLTSYTLTANGRTETVTDAREVVGYSTSGLVYGEVLVSAVNSCGQSSQSASLTIPATGPPNAASLSVELHCSDCWWHPKPFVVSWTPRPREVGVAYPGEERVDVELRPGNITCSEITGNKCMVFPSMLLERVNVTLTLTNDFGSTIDEASFDLRTLAVEEELGPDSLAVTVGVNSLCSGGELPVLVTFGARPEEGGACRGLQNATPSSLSPGDSASFSVDPASLTLGSDETYCYTINGLSDTSGGTPGPSGGGGEREGLSTGAAVALTLSLSLYCWLCQWVWLSGAV
jgi:hypothetical protein